MPFATADLTRRSILIIRRNPWALGALIAPLVAAAAVAGMIPEDEKTANLVANALVGFLSIGAAAAIAHLTANRAADRPTSVADALGAAAQRAGALVLLALIMWVGTMVLTAVSTGVAIALVVATGVAFGGLPGAAVLGIVLAFGIVLAYLYTRLILSIPALMTERIGPLAALRTSWRLTRRGRGVGRTLGGVGLACLPYLALTPAVVHDPKGLVVVLGFAAISLVIAPFVNVYLALLYLDLSAEEEASR